MINTTDPLVSIIIPVYNAAGYLPYCVNSVLGQSHANIEVILINDGSTDDSGTICDRYSARDSRVTVIHQANGGIAKAQNTGLDAAHGEFIAFADNDDILDNRNIELLLHALISTGSDMSKARWRQFGISQLRSVAHEAANGATTPNKVTVFKNPLHAYQTVFCKSLRILGELMGQNMEARYFNEANWCRLYRRELWSGLRFPEGMYAQDVMAAGELYSRMEKVADIDVNLYNWLQSSGSVTHSERSFGFYHDNVVAGIVNFRLALNRDITPMRSYYTMVGSLTQETGAHDATEPHNVEELRRDRADVEALCRRLDIGQRLHCMIGGKIRLCEKMVYDRRIKNLP